MVGKDLIKKDVARLVIMAISERLKRATPRTGSCMPHEDLVQVQTHCLTTQLHIDGFDFA